MTKFINFYGGPGSGKSTASAGVFSELKQLGYNVELVPEFAKDLAWEDRRDTLTNQIYVTARQFHMIKRLIGKTDIIVTDSPVLLGCAYAPLNYPSVYDEVIKWCHGQVYTPGLDFYLLRGNHFDPRGRIHDLEAAKALDAKIKMDLINFTSRYHEVEMDVDNILKIILKELYAGT